MIIVTAEQAHGVINAAMWTRDIQRIRNAHTDVDQAVEKDEKLKVYSIISKRGTFSCRLFRLTGMGWRTIAKLAPARARGYLTIQGVEGAEQI